MKISPDVLESSPQHRHSFTHATPFKHTVIENFFEPAFAERLLAEFPVFNPELAKNEIYGGVWGKAVNTKIRQISPTYEQLYELIASAEFLDFMSQISGIPGLLPDPAHYGGGTHENRHGQDLDPHVDFNYDEPQKLHRRLNLIVYLNKDWEPDWGGSLEIHSNPRRPSENQIRSYAPTFNRAVLFETNEYSWHGFPKIDLPKAERHRSRKSISIYLYTRDRPAEEIAPVHGTFYVHRPLDKRYRAGYALTEADVKDLEFQMDRRDKWIEKYQQMELDKGRELQQKNAYILDLLSRVRAPLTGCALQQGTSTGSYADGWVADFVRFTVKPLKPVAALKLRGWRPKNPSGLAKITLQAGDKSAAARVDEGAFEIHLPLDQPIDTPLDVEIRCHPALKVENDDRSLAFILIEVELIERKVEEARS
jgi:Rps23 Pro-64 3,4-dihydroxylase Tpa1-like proline 4-hydroxylase